MGIRLPAPRTRATTLVHVLVLTAVAMVAVAPSVSAQQRLAAPPASDAAVSACRADAAAAAPTAAVERAVSGVGELGGCVTDAAGIAHIFVEWSSADDREHGRICTNPPVRDDAWRCQWDTTLLEPGSYTVSLIAIDAAGNRGGFDQAYRVERAPDPAPVAPQDPPGVLADDEPPATSIEPATDSEAPTQPADIAPPVEPAPVEAPPAPDAPVESTAPLEAGAPAEAVEPAQALPSEAASPADPVDLVDDAAEPLPVATPLELLVAGRLEACARLELAPGVRPDRSLSLAVLECMRPALEALGAAELALDEIPVPPAVEVRFADPAALAAADELLPAVLAGVELRPVLLPPPSAAPTDESAADDAAAATATR